MRCPQCKHENIAGVDTCESCGQSLTNVQMVPNEMEESISRHGIDVLCPRKPVIVDGSITVRDGIAQMVKNRIGCLMVEEAGKCVGIFTERDVLNKITPHLATLDSPIKDFMTADPEMIKSDDPVGYGLKLMDEGGYRHLPVVDGEDGLAGIVSVRDILRFLCVRFAEIRTKN